MSQNLNSPFFYSENSSNIIKNLIFFLFDQKVQRCKLTLLRKIRFDRGRFSKHILAKIEEKFDAQSIQSRLFKKGGQRGFLRQKLIDARKHREERGRVVLRGTISGG